MVRHSIVEERWLDEYPGLLFGKSWAEVNDEIENATVQLCHGSTEVGKFPDKGVPVSKLQIHGEVASGFVDFHDLFMLAHQIGCNPGFLFLGSPSLYLVGGLETGL